MSSRSEAALAAGEFEIFLGKMHHHMLIPGWLTTFHPDVDGLRDDIAGMLKQPPFDRLAAIEVMRRNKGFYDFPAARIEFGESAQPSADRVTLSIYELSVALDASGELILRTCDGRELALYLTLADHQHYAPFALFTPRSNRIY